MGGYLAYIDGLRAVAVLAVILFHLDPQLLPGGFVGVDVFFVISGYVVSCSVSRSAGMPFGRFMVNFYARRLLRIAPALVVCLLVTTLATVLFIPYAWLSGTAQRTGLAAFFGLSNFVLAATAGDYFSPLAEYNSFTHTWSLGVEEQYYAVFPLLVLPWLRGRRTLSGVVFALAAVVSFALAVRAAAAQPDRAFYLIYFRFWELAAGALLFQTMEGRPVTVGARAGAVLSLAAIAVAAVTASPGSTPFPGAILPVLGTLGAILFFRALPESSGLSRTFTHPVPVYLGRISYSLYLWHWPVFVLFRWTTGLATPGTMSLAVALTFAAAAASHRWVESPPRRPGFLAGWPRAGVVGVGLATALLGWGMASGIWAARPAISLSNVSRHPGDWFGVGMVTQRDGCRLAARSYPMTDGSALSMSRTDCTAPVTLAHHIFVVGDSHASAYEPMLRQVAMDTGAPIDLLAAGGCGVLSLLYPEPPNCRAFQRAALGAVRAAAAPGDIVFLPALRMPRLADQFVLLGEAAARAQVASAAALRTQQEADFAATLRMLAEPGVTVILEAPLPVFRLPAFRCADWFNRGNPICAGGPEIPRATIEAFRAPVLAAFGRLAATAPNLHVWDPLNLLCPDRLCAVMRNGRPLFFDGDHLSGLGNEVVTHDFERFLASLT